jgi:hypothetical protein
LDTSEKSVGYRIFSNMFDLLFYCSLQFDLPDTLLLKPSLFGPIS